MCNLSTYFENQNIKAIQKFGQLSVAKSLKAPFPFSGWFHLPRGMAADNQKLLLRRGWKESASDGRVKGGKHNPLTVHRSQNMMAVLFVTNSMNLF